MQSLRPTDRAARYGAEEFAVLLSETGLQGALALAERIRSIIAEKPVAISAEQSIRVTASLGVAARPDDGRDVESLIGCADKALHRAKQGGRNAVVAFSRLT